MKISIVIPLYNKVKSIKRAVLSVLKQTHKDFELIIVDDGSTDKSLDVIKKIIDNRINIVTQLNTGVSAARNNGVSQSSTNYVCFLDADDEWMPFFLEEMISLIKSYPNNYLYCLRYKEKLENGTYFLGKLSLDENYKGIIGNYFKEYANSRSLTNSSSVCVSKSQMRALGGFPEGVKVGEDIYLWLILSCSGGVAFSGKISAIIYRDAENRTKDRVGVAVQYYLKYFNSNAGRVLIKGLSSERRFWLKYFIIKNTLINSLNCLYVSDIITFNSYMTELKGISNISAFMISKCKYILPPPVLLILKNIRNVIQNKI